MLELKNFCGGDREIQLYRELTKKFEEHIGNNINEVIEKIKDKEIIGEITVLIRGIKNSKNQVFRIFFHIGPLAGYIRPFEAINRCWEACRF